MQRDGEDSVDMTTRRPISNASVCKTLFAPPDVVPPEMGGPSNVRNLEHRLFNRKG